MADKKILTNVTLTNLAAQIKTTFAKKTDVPTKVSDLTNDSNFQTETQVASAISAQIGSVYRPAGSVAFANLPEASAANLGKVYNITDDFTSTASFVEGAGKSYKAGADVGVVSVEEDGNTVYKYNVFANFVDLSSYMGLVSGATANNLAALDANGQVIDGGVAVSKLLTDDDITDYTAEEIAAMLAD